MQERFWKSGKNLAKVQRKFNIKRAEGAADPWGQWKGKTV
jgi:hypothetical protein